MAAFKLFNVLQIEATDFFSLPSCSNKLSQSSLEQDCQLLLSVGVFRDICVGVLRLAATSKLYMVFVKFDLSLINYGLFYDINVIRYNHVKMSLAAL